jgi:hypothetical protein
MSTPYTEADVKTAAAAYLAALGGNLEPDSHDLAVLFPAVLDAVAGSIAARAWDRGYSAGWSDGGDANVAGLDPDDEHHNPYRDGSDR